MNDEQLFQLAGRLLDLMEAEGDAALNDEQHTLLAYCYLDGQVQEGGWIQLIASGYGEYVFHNPLADSLRRWRIKLTPRVLDKAAKLYAACGSEIEAAADALEDGNLDEIRSRFPEFEELDGEYYDCADEDLQAVCAYVADHRDKFYENVD